MLTTGTKQNKRHSQRLDSLEEVSKFRRIDPMNRDMNVAHFAAAAAAAAAATVEETSVDH